MALQVLKAAMNTDEDGQAGIQVRPLVTVLLSTPKTAAPQCLSRLLSMVFLGSWFAGSGRQCHAHLVEGLKALCVWRPPLGITPFGNLAGPPKLPFCETRRAGNGPTCVQCAPADHRLQGGPAAQLLTACMHVSRCAVSPRTSSRPAAGGCAFAARQVEPHRPRCMLLPVCS